MLNNFHNEQESFVQCKLVTFEKCGDKIKISKIGEKTTEVMTLEELEELINKLNILKWSCINTNEKFNTKS